MTVLLECKHNQVITHFGSFAASLLSREWNMKTVSSSIIFSCITFHVTAWNAVAMNCFSMAKTVVFNPLKLDVLLACFLWETQCTSQIGPCLWMRSVEYKQQSSTFYQGLRVMLWFLKRKRWHLSDSENLSSGANTFFFFFYCTNYESLALRL